MISFRSLFLLAALTLSGCAAETCADRPCSPDERLVEAVRVKLAEHPGLVADHLQIEAQGGTVYAHGLVSTDLEFRMLDEIVRGVPGVKRFVNATSVDNARY